MDDPAEFSSQQEVCRGIRDGFRIGFDRKQKLRKATANMLHTIEHLEVIRAYLLAELERGAVLGPLDCSSMLNVHASKFRGDS